MNIFINGNLNVSNYFIGLNKEIGEFLLKYNGGGLFYELDSKKIKGILFSFIYINEIKKTFSRIILKLKNIEQIKKINELITNGNYLFNKYFTTRLKTITFPIITDKELSEIKDIEIYEANINLFQGFSDEYDIEKSLNYPKIIFINEVKFNNEYLNLVLNKKMTVFLNFLNKIQENYENLLKYEGKKFFLNATYVGESDIYFYTVFYNKLLSYFDYFYDITTENEEYKKTIYETIKYLAQNVKENIKFDDEMTIENFFENSNIIQFDKQIFMPKYSLFN